MNNSILIVAPHADDETLGCGGTILRFIREGFQVHWLIVTDMDITSGFSQSDIKKRDKEIKKVFDLVTSVTKVFRYPFVKKIYAYETISETDFGMKPEDRGFRPNVFINIDKYIEKKLSILEIFETEIADFPFPRIKKAVDAIASIRGVQAGTLSAEAFMLLKEII